MYFRQFVRDGLGCASYLIGDTDAGECVVVDPQLDVSEYVVIAGEKGMAIRYVIETHNHADHISGHARLAHLGAEVAIHKDAGVEYPHRPLEDGEVLEVGAVRLRVLHTPGHRPEHIALSVADTSRAEEPWLVLTGDALFVGDVGRPDLAVEAHEGASQLYASLREKILPLADGVEVYPAHVEGSLCGKGMSPKGSSTVGFERKYNPPLTEKDRESFVQRVTTDLPPQPPQFERIVEKNRGPFQTAELDVVPLQPAEVEETRKQGGIILDVRSPEAFGGGHIPGALNVDLHGGQFGTRASWLLTPEKPVVLVTETTEDFDRALSDLSAVGQEGVKGYLLGGMHAWDTGGRPLAAIAQMSVDDLRKKLEGNDKSLQV
ncbi:MAG TPA: MBL fold metallo-hydrolase, partial [Chloroflexia bacterium]|nr:MBL fold metallo-hydrolase [Chloroflexia bacterium]